MKLDAECTWGDGPDVLLTIDEKMYDLTADEAFDLAAQLTMAAQYARYHEQTAIDGDKGAFGFHV